MATLYTTHIRHVRPAAPRRLPDVREAPVGTFLGIVAPGAPVGSFGNVPHLRRQGAGTFAGDADVQRQGSFGDHDLTDIAPDTVHERFMRLPDAA
jgi:hypothetical protein